MIPIRIKDQDLVDDFFTHVSSFVIQKEWMDEIQEWCTDNNYSFEDLVKADIEELKQIKDNLHSENSDVFSRIYSEFSNSSKGLKYSNEDGANITYSGWDLIKEIGITVCPYCNRSYIQNIQNINQHSKKRRTSEYDHFYPKSRYPHLAISFYNLIPSCKVCNQLKGKKDLGISPYEINNEAAVIRWEPEDATFVYPKGKIKIDIIAKVAEMKTNIEVLGLNDLYSNHTDIVQEILMKGEIYSSEYLQSLIEQFPDLIHSEEEAIRIVFGNYTEEADLGKRPLAKLTRDIVKELGY
jgi:hypothetical protein